MWGSLSRHSGATAVAPPHRDPPRITRMTADEPNPSTGQVQPCRFTLCTLTRGRVG